MYLVDDGQWDNFIDSLGYNIIQAIHIHRRETRPKRVPSSRDTDYPVKPTSANGQFP